MARIWIAKCKEGTLKKDKKLRYADKSLIKLKGKVNQHTGSLLAIVQVELRKPMSDALVGLYERKNFAGVACPKDAKHKLKPKGDGRMRCAGCKKTYSED